MGKGLFRGILNVNGVRSIVFTLMSIVLVLVEYMLRQYMHGTGSYMKMYSHILDFGAFSAAAVYRGINVCMFNVQVVARCLSTSPRDWDHGWDSTSNIPV